MIEVTGLRHDYGGVTVVELPQWRVEQGDRCLVLGPSGSGKTTLLHIIAGLLTPSAGKVVVAGQELARLPAGQRDRFRGRHIGIVFQQLHLVTALTVAQNLALAAYMAGRKAEPERIEAVLARLGLAGKGRAVPHALSFGQAQRVALARALVNRPQVIIADEPTSNLDDANAARVIDLLIETAAEEAATLVVATHDHRIKSHIERRLELPDRNQAVLPGPALAAAG